MRLPAITDIFFNNLEILNFILLGQKSWSSIRVFSASTGMSGICARQELGLKLNKTHQLFFAFYQLSISSESKSFLKVIDFC